MRISVVGVGSLGSALVKALLSKGVVVTEELRLYNRTMTDYLNELKCTGIAVHGPKTSTEIVDTPEILIIAVKPQEATAALTPWANSISLNTIVISMMAGVRIDALSGCLGGHRAIVRAMPNLCATIEMSATAYFATSELVDSKGAEIRSVLSAFGAVYQLLEEGMLDGATAIAGSGPAYLCWLAERMIASAEEFGFEREQARHLVLQTLLGTSTLLSQKQLAPAALREMVTSRGGTTAAAVATLEEGGGEELFEKALRAAKERAKTLSKKFSDPSI